MPHISPHLWFNTQAREAAELYVSVFGKNSAIHSVTTIHDTPSGDCDVVSFQLRDHSFMAISAGPEFTFNPSISFMVNFDPSNDEHAEENLNKTWDRLSAGGTALMPLQEYPFSKRYGWIQDKYGVSWQLILTDPAGEPRPFIIPSLLFTNAVCGRAEEAIDWYVSIFTHAKRGVTARYPSGMEPDKEGTLMFADFMLEKQWFAAMDSARKHDFNFNEAVSLLVHCSNQKEVDYYWEKLIADGGEEGPCGWLKDKFGVSWQVNPDVLGTMLNHPNKEKAGRAMQAMLHMKKIDIAQLQRAFDGA